MGPDADELTDQLLAARDGDRAALAGVIRFMQPEVWRMASHLVAPGEADDVTQEVFLQVWRALPGFRGDSSARTWLLTIARRTCVDAVRARVRWRRLNRPIGSGLRVRAPAGAGGNGRALGSRDPARRRRPSRVRAHAGGRLFVRGDRRDLRRARRHRPVTGRAGPRRPRRTAHADRSIETG